MTEKSFIYHLTADDVREDVEAGRQVHVNYMLTENGKLAVVSQFCTLGTMAGIKDTMMTANRINIAALEHASEYIKSLIKKQS